MTFFFRTKKKTALNFCCHSQLLNDNPLTVNFMQSLALSSQFTHINTKIKTIKKKSVTLKKQLNKNL